MAFVFAQFLPVLRPLDNKVEELTLKRKHFLSDHCNNPPNTQFSGNCAVAFLSNPKKTTTNVVREKICSNCSNSLKMTELCFAIRQSKTKREFVYIPCSARRRLSKFSFVLVFSTNSHAPISSL